MKIVTIIGARPQFIKAATVSRTIINSDKICEILVHTGQHFDHNMSDVFFNELEIPKPHYNLGIGSCSHGAMTGRQLEAIENILNNECPDWVLVYGDTNSTLAAAIAAVKLHIPVAHVEAGLRSFNRSMPEEINRILVDHCSSLFFAPTQTAVNNLDAEGIKGEKVVLSGDVMFDAALFYGQKAEQKKYLLDDLGINNSRYVLMTFHRAENTDDVDVVKQIVKGILEVAQVMTVVLPLHPRTRKVIDKLGLLSQLEQTIKVIDPVGYLDMVILEKNAALIVTDSGGVQKEAYFHRIPCITLRKETEWIELIDNGWNKLVDPSQGKIYEAIVAGHKSKAWEPLYGNGDAADCIVKELLEFNVE